MCWKALGSSCQSVAKCRRAGMPYARPCENPHPSENDEIALLTVLVWLRSLREVFVKQGDDVKMP